jgi:hypothetical protein
MGPTISFHRLTMSLFLGPCSLRKLGGRSSTATIPRVLSNDDQRQSFLPFNDN